jgi:hypothetical protein
VKQIQASLALFISGNSVPSAQQPNAWIVIATANKLGYF